MLEKLLLGLNTVKTVPKLIRNAALKRKFCLNELKRSVTCASDKSV